MCYFFEHLLVHTKGKWMGKPFRLLSWQRELLRTIFGWKRKDGTRLYRVVYIEVPRKNGKSELVSGIALYMLFADQEPAAEVYSAAADRGQAAIVFEMAKLMRDLSPELRIRSKPYRHSIVVPRTHSRYWVLSSDASTKHGFSASANIIDELHAHKNRELFDVLVTSVGAREQPLTIAITTAGWDRKTVCWEQHDYALKIQKGILEDPAFLGCIFAADPEDDWEDPKVWAKANPSLGETITEDYLREQAAKAKASPAALNTFLQLHLNIWTQQANRWIPLHTWDASEGPVVLEELKDRVCFGGLDLATVRDLAAFVLAFPFDGNFKILPRFFMPEDNIAARVKEDRVPYDAWQRDGLLILTPGNVIDYDYIYEQVLQDAKQFRIQEIGYDDWNATQIVTRLVDSRMNMVPIRQGFASLSPPSKEFEKLVLKKRIHHGGDPVLRWMMDNVVVERDAANNIKPSKKKSQEKIDGVVAMIMALDRALRMSPNAGRSVYEGRGVIVL